MSFQGFTVDLRLTIVWWFELCGAGRAELISSTGGTVGQKVVLRILS